MVRAFSLATAGQRMRNPSAKLGVLITAMLLASGASAQSRSERPVYKDPAAPVEQLLLHCEPLEGDTLGAPSSKTKKTK